MPKRLFLLTLLIAQTDIKDPSLEPSADDFLARERAILGDDATQFATVEDAGFDDDLLGAESGNVQFESQFPDINVNQVRVFQLSPWPCH